MDPLITIPAAIGLGALHSLEPGHGKGAISAYLIAVKGRTKDAVLLGCASALAHTCSIAALAMTASYVVRTLATTTMTAWIDLLSGLMILMLGVSLMLKHFRPGIVSLGAISGGASLHQNDNHLFHSHAHARHRQPAQSAGRIVLVGVATGLIPCPSAVAIFLAALASDRLAAGFELVVAFSAGSAAAMCLIGILVVKTGEALRRSQRIAFARSLNAMSSWLIVFIGVFVILRSLP